VRTYVKITHALAAMDGKELLRRYQKSMMAVEGLVSASEIFTKLHMLEDKINGHYLKTHILKDKYMEKFRKVYFNGDGDI
jgi:hypothetical protein